MSGKTGQGDESAHWIGLVVPGVLLRRESRGGGVISAGAKAQGAARKSANSLVSCGLSEGIKPYPHVPAGAGLSVGYVTENRGFCQCNWPPYSGPISLKMRAEYPLAAGPVGAEAWQGRTREGTRRLAGYRRLARTSRHRGLLAYRNTLEADALKLVAKKLQSSLAVEGKLPEGGLVSVAAARLSTSP